MFHDFFSEDESSRLGPLEEKGPLFEEHLVAHQELVEIIAAPGDGAVGVAELDCVPTTKRHDKRPTDFQVLLHIAEPVSSNGLSPTREVGEIQ